MNLLGFILFIVLIISSVAAWINTKIILEEIDKIKKFIGMPEDKSVDNQPDLFNSGEHNKID